MNGLHSSHIPADGRRTWAPSHGEVSKLQGKVFDIYQPAFRAIRRDSDALRYALRFEAVHRHHRISRLYPDRRVAPLIRRLAFGLKLSATERGDPHREVSFCPAEIASVRSEGTPMLFPCRGTVVVFDLDQIALDYSGDFRITRVPWRNVRLAPGYCSTAA